MRIPFVKVHAGRNDFLFTWASSVGSVADTPALARAICDRHSGVGGDGWYIVSQGSGAGSEIDVALSLYNADGSYSELSGNGTRCAGALLADEDRTYEKTIRICTGAGIKVLRLIERTRSRFLFEMQMGKAVLEAREKLELKSGAVDGLIINVGNPQCSIPVDSFDLDWRSIGAEIERHPRFPNRTNVSFVRRTEDPHVIEVRIWERGVGETQSSGTGSMGAAAAAKELGWVASPLRVETASGALEVRWEGEEIYMTGPAEIVGRGEYYWQE